MVFICNDSSLYEQIRPYLAHTYQTRAVVVPASGPPPVPLWQQCEASAGPYHAQASS